MSATVHVTVPPGAPVFGVKASDEMASAWTTVTVTDCGAMVGMETTMAACPGAMAVIENVAEVCPSGIEVLPGTDATSGFVLESVTAIPPAGAGSSSVTVPMPLVDAAIMSCWSDNELSVTTGAGAGGDAGGDASGDIGGDANGEDGGDSTTEGGVLEGVVFPA